MAKQTRKHAYTRKAGAPSSYDEFSSKAAFKRALNEPRHQPRMTGLGTVSLPKDYLTNHIPAKQSLAKDTHNPRHTCSSANWQSPEWVMAPGREFMKGFDLDPASCAKANKTVKARNFFSPRDNGLRKRWEIMSGSIYVAGWLNPPGGRIGNDSSVKRWWLKLLAERTERYFGHFLFLSFSIEAMQVTQVDTPASILDFPTVVFKKRLDFVDPATGKPVKGNTHSSCLTYVPGRIDMTGRFWAAYEQFGVVIDRKRRLA